MVDNKEKGLACVGATVAIVVLLVATIIINGFVLQQLWAWFVVPLGAPSITLTHALGLSMLLGAFGIIRKVTVDKEDPSWGKATAEVLSPLALLG